MKSNRIKLLVSIAVLTVFSLSGFSQFEFVKHGISEPSNPSDVYTADINGDDHMDILTVSADNGGSVIWWKNNGSQEFSRKVIATGFSGPRSVRGGDIDMDGDIDVIAASLQGNKISWWENDGEEGFTEKVVNSDWVGPHTVELCDLDRDGDMDILGSQFDASENMSEIAWWENNGSQEWTMHIVTSRFQQSPFVYGSDMDNDGDIDLIGSGELNGEVCWWENDGQENWTEHIIDSQFHKAHTVLARDFDKDGDMDILAHAVTSSLQAWYENDGNGSFKKIDMENLGGAIWMDCGDFDLDGDFDLIATGMSESNLVCYENNGREALTRQDLPGPIASGFALNITDLDSDGDLDIVAIGRGSNLLAWWENKLHNTSFFNAPKWIFYDADEQLSFVSNEEEGSIVRTEKSGYQYCIRNGLPICTSLTYLDGFVWAAVGVSIYKLNPLTGVTEAIMRLPVQFIQGLTSDESGAIYITDPLSGTLLKIDKATGQSQEISSGLDYPQSIKYDSELKKLIVLDGEFTTTIKLIDPLSGEITKEVETDIIPGGDITPDLLGNHYISSPEEGVIYASTRNFQDPVFAFSAGNNSPVGLTYYSDDGSLGMISHGLDSLIIIPATATGNNLIRYANIQDFKVFPNPVKETLYVKTEEQLKTNLLLKIYSNNGKEVFSRIMEKNSHEKTIECDLSMMEAGVYYVKIAGKDFLQTQSIIKN